MIKKIDSVEYAAAFLDIYNSANKVFFPNVPPLADPEVFIKQIKNEQNYAYFTEQDTMAGFMSYTVQDNIAQLNSIYVGSSFLRKSIGTQLLYLFEEQTKDYPVHYLIALKDAAHAHSFYIKNGYKENTPDVLKDTHLNPWDKMFYKKNKS